MFGMETMSGAVSGLRNDPVFVNLFLAFKNPLLGVVAGAVLTGIIQSSSASVGILQALSATGAVSYAAAIPHHHGPEHRHDRDGAPLLHRYEQKRAPRRRGASDVQRHRRRRPAFGVHRSANSARPGAARRGRDPLRHRHCPFGLQPSLHRHAPARRGLLEKLAIRIVPDSGEKEQRVELDERLLATPALALSRSRAVASDMAEHAVRALKDSLCRDRQLFPRSR